MNSAFKRKTVLFLFLLGMTSAFQCGKQTLSMKENTPEEQFEEAKRIFDKKDYFKAKTQFTVIVLNNPGHRIIESAQYYLAESHYKLKEYIQAISEYEKLIRSMPQSPFVDDSRYKVGLCYFELSPGYALDQEYTEKAIYQFQLFLEEYPNSDIRSDVEKKLTETRDKLAKKEFKTGELYRKMGYFDSAVISFSAVIDEFYDTQYADDAYYWKGYCLSRMMSWQEAIETLLALKEKHPDSGFSPEADPIIRSAREKLNKNIQ